MADRSVNVRINYVVNTADVQRAAALSVSAQKATDNLRKSVQDYGKTTEQVNKQVTQSTQQASKSFNDLSSAVNLVIAAGAIQKVAQMAIDMASLAGEVDGVTRAFNRLPNATLLLDNLRKSTHGTVNDLELMQKALTAQNFRIPLQNLGTLLEFAAAKAQQTGQEVNHLVDYIVSGIGYRSIKRLDDLGFTANRVKEALGGISLQAASTGQVMDAITKLMNEDLQKTGGYVDTAKTKVEQFNVALRDANVEIARQVETSGFVDWLTSVAKNFKNGTTAIGDFIKGTKDLYDQTVKQQAIKEVTPFTEGKKDVEAIQQEINTRVQLIGRNNDELKQLKERHHEIVDQAGFVKYSDEAELDRIQEQFKYYTKRNDILKTSINLLKQYRDTSDDITKTEEKKSGERSLPNNIAFMSPDASVIKKTRLSALVDRNQLVDVQKQLQEALDNLPAINAKITPYIPMDAWDKISQEFAANWKDLVSSGIQNTANVINAAIQAESDMYSARLNLLQSYYDNEIAMAGDNERKKKELTIERTREEQKLRQEAFEADKEAKRLQTVINGAAAVINAFATLPYPAAIVASAFVAGETAAQLAIISSQKYAGYKDGVLNLKGPGTEKSDSIPAMLSRGESVMTAEETRNSFGILKEIRTGKLNDRILKQMVSNGGSRAVLDDSRIVSAIQNQPKPASIVKQAGHIYEVYTDRQGNKRYIRSKSI